jgi:hypothetical protein
MLLVVVVAGLQLLLVVINERFQAMMLTLPMCLHADVLPP